MKFDPSILLDIKTIIKSPLEFNDRPIGWHVTIETSEGIIGGGVHTNENVASRIAVAEIIERKLFRKLLNNKDESERLLLKEYPTTCGFAVGFEVENCKRRAVAEAIERWAWSKWIDDEFYLSPTTSPLPSLTSIGLRLHEMFDRVEFYIGQIDSSKVPQFPSKVLFGVAIAIKDNGVFPGSRVAYLESDLWEHALVEAYRHLIIFKNGRDKSQYHFPFNRINYFGLHGAEAIKMIPLKNDKNWPNPSLQLLEEIQTGLPNVYMWRALAKDYIGWEKGNEKRFVY